MRKDWAETLSHTRQAAALLKKANPKVAAAFYGLRDAGHASGVLDAKTRELIALAVAATKQCDGCIASHVAAAHKAGATAEEVADALGTAMTISAGSTYVYSLHVLEAFEQLGRAEDAAAGQSGGESGK